MKIRCSARRWISSARCFSARASSKTPEKAQKASFSRRKTPVSPAFFLPFWPPFWYGPSLESWGRPLATGIRSKTQDYWGFQVFLAPRKDHLEMGICQRWDASERGGIQTDEDQ